MKIQIRSSVFETNSSSLHSLVISKVIVPPIQESLYGYFGEYGWGYEELVSQEQKLSYILTHTAMSLIKSNNIPNELNKFLKSPIFQKLNELIRIKTGRDIYMGDCLMSAYNKFGYIDHQSVGILDNYTLEDLVDIIFSESKIIIDNDNH